VVEVMRPLAQMQQQVREVNVANGWFDSDRTFGEDIALLHSEASEMLEAYRETGTAEPPREVRGDEEAYASWPDAIQYLAGIIDQDPDERFDKGDEVLLAQFGVVKPEGIGSEAADVLIRLLDTCERYGIDLDHEFERKIAFNATRGHRHGGKRL
jgi:NTP pyrophosphatase (non-canonical NTP hydrolase)